LLPPRFRGRALTKTSVELQNSELPKDGSIGRLRKVGVRNDLLGGRRVDLVPDAACKQASRTKERNEQRVSRGRRRERERLRRDKKKGTDSFSPFAFSRRYRLKRRKNEFI